MLQKNDSDKMTIIIMSVPMQITYSIELIKGKSTMKRSSEGRNSKSILLRVKGIVSA